MTARYISTRKGNLLHMSNMTVIWNIIVYYLRICFSFFCEKILWDRVSFFTRNQALDFRCAETGRSSLWQQSRAVLSRRQRGAEIQDGEMLQNARLHKSRECKCSACDADCELCTKRCKSAVLVVACTQKGSVSVATVLCVAVRAGVQPRPQPKPVIMDFGLQPYSLT